MHLWKSFTLTFAMYSHIPMPRVEWDNSSMEWVFSCFPLVGVVLGGLLWAWLSFAAWAAVYPSLVAIVSLLLPLLITGGIHMDGLCDTCDALGSHQSKERKLEILKDSHIGAFGVMGCILYLLTQYATWNALTLSQSNRIALALLPVFSRSIVSWVAVTRRNARGSGLLATFTSAAAGRWNKFFILLWCVACAVALALLGLAGRCMLGAALLVSVYFYRMSEREFGGITGDLAGWYLQMLELGMLLAVSLITGVIL